jgi:hypothetical protein
LPKLEFEILHYLWDFCRQLAQSEYPSGMWQCNSRPSERDAPSQPPHSIWRETNWQNCKNLVAILTHIFGYSSASIGGQFIGQLPLAKNGLGQKKGKNKVYEEKHVFEWGKFGMANDLG